MSDNNNNNNIGILPSTTPATKQRIRDAIAGIPALAALREGKLSSSRGRNIFPKKKLNRGSYLTLLRSRNVTSLFTDKITLLTDILDILQESGIFATTAQEDGGEFSPKSPSPSPPPRAPQPQLTDHPRPFTTPVSFRTSQTKKERKSRTRSKTIYLKRTRLSTSLLHWRRSFRHAATVP